MPTVLKNLSSVVALVGVAETTYLTVEHFTGKIPPCTVLQGCGEVLTSQYASVYGVPLALIGLVYYLTILVLTRLEGRRPLVALAAVSSFGLAISAFLVYLQLNVIGAICLYCMASAGTTTLIWILTMLRLRHN